MSPSAPPSDRTVLRARTAVAILFAANGLVFAGWVSRLPTVRADLGLTTGQLGLLLLAISVGSVSALPLTGALLGRFGVRRVLTAGIGLDVVGLVVAGIGGTGAPPAAVAVTAGGLLLMGVGTGVWDVAMNVAGADVERDLGRAIMPRFHAAFSLGTVGGAGLGAAAAAADVSLALHFALMAPVIAAVALAQLRHLHDREAVTDESGDRGSAWRAWTEPRTLLIGLMVLSLALTEGTANDWLAVALVDGYDVAEWVGAAGFAAFVSAMTLGRLVGTALLDRFGRVRVLWATMSMAGVGVLLVVFGGSLPVAVVGALIWGLGASLGFPVGMSAAADDPVHAAARVSVVSTIGYTAFLAGPPLIGFVGDEVGALGSLLVVAVLLVPSALVVPAAREREHPAEAA